MGCYREKIGRLDRCVEADVTKGGEEREREGGREIEGGGRVCRSEGVSEENVLKR